LPSEKRKVAEKRRNRMFSSPRLERFMKSRAYRTAVPVVLLIGLAEHAYWIYHLGKNEPAGFVSRQEWASLLLLTVILFSGCLRYMGYKRAEGFAESLKTLLCMLLFVLYAFYCGAGWSSAAEAGRGLEGGQSYLLQARTTAFAAAAGTALYAIWKWLGAKLTRERRE